MRIEAISFRILLIYLGKSLKIISLSPEFGRPKAKASTFRSRGVPGRLDALLAKSLIGTVVLELVIQRKIFLSVPIHG
jgi:hypothetical protein